VSSNKGQLLSSLFVAALLVSAATAHATDSPKDAVGAQKVTRDGISVEFMPSVAGSGEKRPDPMEGEDVELRFWIRGASGERLAGIRPAAWVDARADNGPNASPGSCKAKVQSFVTGSLQSRPQVDLNTFFILVLNAEPVISVIDPILGFGGSRLYTDVALPSPGSDWVLTKDSKRLFVSMPIINQVAVISTDTWRVVKNIKAGMKPMHLVLSPDEKTLWVADQNADAAAVSVTVIDAETSTVAASLHTGRGPHRVALSSDGSVAAVTNGLDGTVTLVDAKSLRAIRDLSTGPSPITVASSSLSGALYVGDASNGSIAVIDPLKGEISARIQGKPGMNEIRFSPAGRFGFVTIPNDDLVQVIDSSNTTIVSNVAVPKSPDQVAFTETFAYVRSAGADHTAMIRLGDLGSQHQPVLVDFPSGQLAPSVAKVGAVADALIPAPGAAAVIVVNPADKLVYDYDEGMAAPMGSYQTYERTPVAALVVDRSLREVAPGVFSITTKVPVAGMYDVAFFLDSPRVLNCFNLSVRSNPALKKMADAHAVEVEPLLKPSTVQVNAPVEMKFRLTNPNTGKAHTDLKDVRILTFLAPGTWQSRQIAHTTGDGVYSVTTSLPQTGIYYVFLECPSLGLGLNSRRPVILQAVGPEVRKEAP